MGVKLGLYGKIVPARYFRPRLPAATPDPPDDTPVALCWGRVGSLPDPEETEGFEVKTCQETNVEQSRKSDEIRIENPNDAEQYIIVERAREIKFDKRNRNKKPFSGSSATVDADFSTASFDPGDFSPDLGLTGDDDCLVTVKLDNGPTSA